MTHAIGVNVPCTLLGEFVDENQLPVTTASVSVGYAQPTVFVGSFVDSAPSDMDSRQFKVLLRDNRMVTVLGEGLRYLPNPSNPSDQGSYAIVTHAGPDEVVIALFRVSEVTGIFSGGLEEPVRASA